MDYPQFAQRYQLQLNPQQQAAVEATEGPVLLLAVPGSGKTTTLIARLGYLVLGCGVAPGQILTTTYTVAATQELRSRFAARFGGELAGQMAFRTINGVCAGVLAAYARAGHTPFTLITEEGKLTALLRELWQANQEEYPTDTDLRGLRTLITYIKNQMLGEQEIADLEVTAGGDKLRVGVLYRAYCRAMQARHWMDYDDQMVYALAVLRRNPAILQAYRRRYRYFCVDEAQDTSRIQHTLLALLAAESKNLFMVGDEDQSIYGFRAACPEALMDFEAQWPGARVLLMEENYRSTPEIVAAAGAFIRQNVVRREKAMRTPNPAGPAVSQLLCADRREQYRRLAELAAEANRTGTETAVLYRDNDTALPIIDELTRRGIPYRARGTDGLFFGGRIVRDVTDIFTLAAHPADGKAFLRVYYKFGAGITRQQAEAAASGRGPVLAALRKMELSAWARERVQALQTHLKCLPNEPAADALARVVEGMGYGAYLEEHQTDRGRLNILQALAAGPNLPSPAALLARLESLRAIVQQGTAESDSPFILSTIHSSKGLEYDRVVLADVVDGVLPQDPLIGQLPTDAQLATLEEDRRIFYVGMTRARYQLTVVTFRHPALPSAFGRALFPPPRPVRGNGAGESCRPAKRPTALPTATLPTGRKPVAGPKIAALCRDYYPGVRVSHTRYGAGTVLGRDEGKGTITVTFDTAGPHTFLLTAALAARALRLEGL